MTAAVRETGAVVLLLAAGEGRRYGALKQLEPIGGEPMVRRVARTLLRLRRPLVAVTGAGAGAVIAALDGLPVIHVTNHDWRDGLGASLGAGMRAVQARFPKASGALACLADHPMLDAGALQTMLDRHAAAPDRIIAAEHAGKPGPPVLFPADCLSELAAWHGAEGARALLHREHARVERVPMDVADVDTPDDLERVRSKLAQRRERSPGTG